MAQPVSTDGVSVKVETGAVATKMETGHIVKTPAIAEASMAPIAGPFQMPEPVQLDHAIRSKHLENYMTNLLQHPDYVRKSNTLVPLNRELGAQKTIGKIWDKDAWTATITRLVTRGIEHDAVRKSENEVEVPQFADLFRARILAYVSQSFRERMDFCTVWLNEEWYSASLNEETTSKTPTSYMVWTNRVLDTILPYLEAKDRIFMRFLSDLPELDLTMIKKLRTLCVDPDRALLGYTTLQ